MEMEEVMRDEYGKVVPNRTAGTSGVSGPPSDADNPAGPYEREAREEEWPTSSGAATDLGRRDTETPMGLIGSGKPGDTSGSGLVRRPVRIRTEPGVNPRRSATSRSEDRPPGRSGETSPEARA
jgi:hypothetical protein